MQPPRLIDEISYRVVNDDTRAARALGPAANGSRDKVQLALTSAASRLRGRPAFLATGDGSPAPSALTQGDAP
jgi:hypothetical protein